MTKHKTLKRHVRERMTKTGEAYAQARRHVLADPENGGATPSGAAGTHAATAAFRTLLRHAGHEVPEEALLVAGGGVGIGVFAFHYDDFSSLFLAGRHLWHDDLAFLQGLAGRLGVTLEVRETGGRKRAERDLHELVQHGPVVAFVDLGTLGHRGGVEAYYVVTVHEVDPDAGVARIADLADELVEVPLTTLADARARHRKFKNRLLRVADTPTELPLRSAGAAGLRACVDGFEAPPVGGGAGANFQLGALDTLARRMRGDGKDGWSRTFPPGPRLWAALTSFYEYVEHYGTGGGLMRPFFADGLRATGPGARDVAEAYDELGGAWSTAARAALPSRVAELEAMRGVIDDTYAAYDAAGAEAADELAALRERRARLAAAPFPLAVDDARTLVHDLAEHVEGLAARERDALERLAALGGAT